MNVIKLSQGIVGFARRHPRFKTIGIVLIAANEIRGLVTVVAYLKTFGLALPI